MYIFNELLKLFNLNVELEKNVSFVNIKKKKKNCDQVKNKSINPQPNNQTHHLVSPSANRRHIKSAARVYHPPNSLKRRNNRHCATLTSCCGGSQPFRISLATPSQSTPSTHPPPHQPCLFYLYVRCAPPAWADDRWFFSR